jgi:hypothetical protein
MTNIKEMIALCQELLTLDDMERHSTAAIRTFANLFYTHHTFEMLRLPLDELIQCLRDYNGGIATLDRIIATHSSAGDPSLHARASDAAFVAALFARNRYI